MVVAGRSSHLADEVEPIDELESAKCLRHAGLALLGAGAALRKQGQAEPQSAGPQLAGDGSPLDTGSSEIRAAIERYEVELRDLNRVYALPGSRRSGRSK